MAKSDYSKKEKFSELLNDGMELPLPVNYKHLFNLFESLDRNVSLIKNRKQVPLFNTLK